MCREKCSNHHYKFALRDTGYENMVGSSFAKESQSFYQRLIALLAVQQGERVLDLGCGWGTAFPILFASVGSSGSVVGFDVNERFLAISERLFQDHLQSGRLELVLGETGNSLPWPANSFEKIFCHNVLENVADKQFFLNECYRVLKPGGTLLVSHMDFDTVVYNSSYKDLTRTLVHHFADYTQTDWQPLSDGQLGRKLRGFVAHSNFNEYLIHPLVLHEEQYATSGYGFRYSQWVLAIAKKIGIGSGQELQQWVDDLACLDQEKKYYFSINVMAIVACK